jgi:phage gp29-like protein
MKAPQLLDQHGRPVDRSVLTEEIAAATVSGVRSPTTGYPADGLTPARLSNILKEADAGDPIRYMELAETIEERDPHYLGVLATRRRSVAQIEVTVKAGDDSPEAEADATLVRQWLDRDELTDEIFDILDCIGKGYSHTEIMWDTSEGQWMPKLLEHRDPRWFRFARHDLKTPVMLGTHGEELPLPPFKFISAVIKAKSGIPLRSGIARVAMWGYLFKMFTQKDWAIFTQTYGHPVRVGKFGAGATDADKATLLRAVTNIAGDMAAIIPESMAMEFIQSANVGAAHAMYKERCDWLDQQVSKLVLGQTATTDAVVGGLGSGKEHRQVQEDIETADARALAAILNRDLIRPWMQLNSGPRKVYPRLVIARAEQEDLKAFSDAVAPWVDRGLQIEESTILAKFGLPEPKAGGKFLMPARAAAPATDPLDANREIKRNPAFSKRVEPVPGQMTQLQAENALAGKKQRGSDIDTLTDRMVVEADPAIDAMLDQIEAMFDAAGSMAELREMLLAGFPDISPDALADVIAMGLLAANGAGRVVASADAGGAAG